MAKIITVFGATGVQGGSVVRALLEDKTFQVRGATRNLQSDKAKSLAEQGVDMVQASFEDVPSLEQAMTGSYGVFAVTNYWEIFDQAREEQMGRNLVDAAKKVGVQHFIYSGLQHVLKVLGKPAPHLDGKAAVEDYMFDSGVPATSVRYSTYMENIFTILPPQKTGEGVYTWNMPMEGKPLNWICASSAGPAVVSVFKNPDKYIGRAVGLSAGKKTVDEFCEIINKYIAPLRMIPSQMTAEQFGKLGFPGADDLGVMFEFFQTDYPEYSVEETMRLDPQTKDLDTFVRENKEKIIAVLK